MTILDEIVAVKRREVETEKISTPVKDLEKNQLFKRQTFSLISSLANQKNTGIIAEFKRASPSRGYINQFAGVEVVTGAYARYGASGLSILTDQQFFKGSAADLGVARHLDLPILRKDFIVDEYQVVQTRAMGADVILLIAACLSKQQLRSLSGLATSIGLEVLLEIHDEEEMDHIHDKINLVGINSRDLKTFTVDMDAAQKMAAQLSDDFLLVAESGIQNPSQVNELRKYFDGFLIGETFMKEADPGFAFQKFVEELQ